MFNHLQKIFQGPLASGAGPQDEASRLRLATVVLLLEAAHADAEFADDERVAVTKAIRTRFALDDAAAAELLEAAGQARRESGDLYQFARQLNESFPLPRKLAVAELLWEVVYSDGTLEAHEDSLMHKLGTLLSIRHEDLMALKRKVRGRSEP
jgi:uncharacterized tellurite resistance protein B-like protein